MSEFPLLSRGVNVVIDGQWGGAGKGKLASHLAARHDVAISCADFAANARHSIRIGDDTYEISCVPSGFVNLNAILYLAPTSAIVVEDLLSELDELEEFAVRARFHLHPNVAIIRPEHVSRERAELSRIASTMRGVGACTADKIMRRAPIAADVPELRPFIRDMTETLTTAARSCTILAETSQGFDLSLNHGHRYPYVTSRDVTTCSVLSNLGLPPSAVGNVWGCLRPFPKRVGAVDDCFGSGPCHGDQHEVDWETLRSISGDEGLEPERSTCTVDRVDRVFSFSRRQVERFLVTCEPTHLFVNSVEQLDASCAEYRGDGSGLPPDVLRFIHKVNDAADGKGVDCRVRLVGTGPNDADFVQV